MTSRKPTRKRKTNHHKGKVPMAKEPDNKEAKTEQAPTQAKPVGLGIKLVPVAQSDQPVLSNLTMVNVSPGMAFIDFGFLEPGLLAALPRMARSGGKLPERLNGKLAVRVALGFDSLANLHQQLGQVLKGLSEVRAQARSAEIKKN